MNKILIEFCGIPPIPRNKTQILRLRSGADWVGHAAFETGSISSVTRNPNHLLRVTVELICEH